MSEARVRILRELLEARSAWEDQTDEPSFKKGDKVVILGDAFKDNQPRYGTVSDEVDDPFVSVYYIDDRSGTTRYENFKKTVVKLDDWDYETVKLNNKTLNLRQGFRRREFSDFD